MFFGDPAAAFANIRRALRPAGRLVMMVWQAPERNEWEVAIRRSLGLPRSAAVTPGQPDAFSLADPPAVTGILRAAGRLREALAAHLSEDGVWFSSRAWLITACRD